MVGHIIVPGVPSGDRGNWGKVTRRDESHECQRLEKINVKDVELFRNGLVHEFYRFKALIALEQVNTSVDEKKEES